MMNKRSTSPMAMTHPRFHSKRITLEILDDFPLQPFVVVIPGHVTAYARSLAFIPFGSQRRRLLSGILVLVKADGTYTTTGI